MAQAVSRTSQRLVALRWRFPMLVRSFVAPNWNVHETFSADESSTASLSKSKDLHKLSTTEIWRRIGPANTTLAEHVFFYSSPIYEKHQSPRSHGVGDGVDFIDNGGVVVQSSVTPFHHEGSVQGLRTRSSVHAKFTPGSNFFQGCVRCITTSTARSPEPEARDLPPKASGPQWIEHWLPESWRPYAYLARMDKPIGTWLLAWPCFWSISLAAPMGSMPDLHLLALFGSGAVLLRGAGCTVNDLLDRSIDVKVARTKLRPIASGRLTPFQGFTFLGGQLLLGLGILLQLNDFSKVLGATSLLLVGSYPLVKRWSYWPQAYLGLTFNWGALLGWAAVHGSLDVPVVLPLYLSGVCWTIVYDTIYAHQDKEDDLMIGVKSTALRFGDDTAIWLAGFGVAFAASLSLAGFNAGLGWPFYVSVMASASHIAWQILTVNINNRQDCNSKFVSNKWLGAIVCTGIVLDKVTS